MAKAIVGSMSDWSGVLKDLFRQIDDGSIALYQMQAFLEHRDPFTTLPDIDWPLAYEKLGMKAEYEEATASGLVLPRANPGLWMPLMVKGVTCNKVVAGYRKLEVQVYTYVDDLDANLAKNDRDPNRDGHYLVGFRRTIAADEENRGKNANVLAGVNHKGITLLERLLLGFGYYVTTGQHLDVKTATLCSGSCFSDGGVPGVSWSSGSRGVYADYYSPDRAGDGLRSRSAVSLLA